MPLAVSPRGTFLFKNNLHKTDLVKKFLKISLRETTLVNIHTIAKGLFTPIVLQAVFVGGTFDLSDMF